MINRLWERLVRTGESLLGAPTDLCAYCRASVKRYALPSLALCSRCTNQIPWIESIQCPHCGRMERCMDCTRRGRSSLSFNRSAVKYDERMKEWLAAYKYGRNERLQALLSSMLFQTYKRYENEYARSGAIHWITPVPVSRQRMEERGFNQAGQLAAGFGARASIPVVPLLGRRRDTAKQSYKSRSERLDDLKDAFAIDEDGIKMILKKTVLRPINIVIIDDVYTTGSTLHHCAKTIAEHADANVYGLTWAR
ncbi:ComF family protein [Paenibacillus hemerocallicola]|uniref:ComF family protein n=1 Tax=Paenibacillus hemerocallicola TaxID=1172614 RepID=A0A5C4T6V5_9BACL|nr:ComF family protein [Paenibacillus hemerocallicola]TNJ64751.1 ComF family protein [Paenibacillus hemerocallicola]